MVSTSSNSSDESDSTKSAANESTANDAGNSTMTKTTSSNVGDSCTWYADSNCTQPRTGFDCLNVLLSTDECAIDPDGTCVSMSVYKEYEENRPYYEAPSRYFPASNYTYCSANDSVCSSCIAEWASDYESTGSVDSTTYCTGLDGCVCVADCEVSDWQQKVIADECGNSINTVGRAEVFSANTRRGILIGTGIAVGFVFTLLGIRRCRRQRTPTNYGPGSIPRRPQSGPQLNLSGWKSLHEKLIETEHGAKNVVNFDASALTAEPVPGADVVTVEVGQPARSNPLQSRSCPQQVSIS
ncbi:hypothetical protein PHYBOEH_001056 [Phytophthora boehmeriae]|uniref:Uncharacterized protein n=1 Tax=Phytophthora boehmeriae TaxID=109152 RepID=A0A8T1WWV1_9STRA|nr:hypothetical protein PHYBOEH_001056 [Phytophthora boehmeriae]